MQIGRRTIMQGAVAAGIGTLVATGTANAAELINPAAQSATESLRGAFTELVKTLTEGRLDDFWATIDAGAVIIDEDIPFRMTKADFQDHINFHLNHLWENFTWKPRDPQFRVFGDTGVAAGYATFRGKPVDAGFRQRQMVFTQGWHRSNGRWVLINWHQSPFDGHIIEGSPG